MATAPSLYAALNLRLKKKKNTYICSSQLRADQMPGSPREGQLMWALSLSTRQ